jgi:aminoglycoside phosphotransferase family enzyme/predicted kinase
MGVVNRGGAAPRPELVEALLAPAAYPHAVTQVEHLETHISHVFLTGALAYKIKKPVDLGFLDFSTLEKRREYCSEELRINRRLAPDLYLAVVPITGTASAPHVEADGDPIEYAVKMRQFPQTALAEHVLERGALTPALIDALADDVARFHASLAPAPAGSAWGSAQSIVDPARQNFSQLSPLAQDADATAVAALRAWTERESQRLRPVFDQRQGDGHVRECHGDLHLANIVLLDGRLRIFDALEFSPALRWIDVINEVAFLVMDLAMRARDDLAWRFLNTYLEHTGDYDGVRVLRYYAVYRALVRAKIAAIRAAQPAVPEPERTALQEKCRQHLAVAQRFADVPPLGLVITHGLSGSGKTWGSQILLETLPAVRVRSDVERKRMHGLAHAASSASPVGAGLYTQDTTHATYERLAALADTIVSAGHTAIVDAAFLKRAQRDRFRSLASARSAPFRILSFAARPETLRQRIEARAARGTDASEAGLEVLDAQLAGQEPPALDEQAFVVAIGAEQATPDSLRDAAQSLRTRGLDDGRSSSAPLVGPGPGR